MISGQNVLFCLVHINNVCMHTIHAYIIESTKTRVNPGFFRGTPPENRGSTHVFSQLPSFFPGIPGGGVGMHGNSGGVPRNSGVISGIPGGPRNSGGGTPEFQYAYGM